jgi:hypothetical protein
LAVIEQLMGGRELFLLVTGDTSPVVERRTMNYQPLEDDSSAINCAYMHHFELQKNLGL